MDLSRQKEIAHQDTFHSKGPSSDPMSQPTLAKCEDETHTPKVGDLVTRSQVTRVKPT